MKTFKDLRASFEKLKKYKSPDEIAKKHGVDVSLLMNQLKDGVKVEQEHTNDKKLAIIIALHHLEEIPNYYSKLKRVETASKNTEVSEGTLHHWFKGSKSKDGKPGWVQADGSPCANEPGETKTPKCFSSERLKKLKRKGKKGKELIRSAIRRKRKHDKYQQEKTGGESPTYVRTFAKGKKDPNYIEAEPGLKESIRLFEAEKDKPGKGSGTKDACYYKVKSRFRVWPSAYASAALVRCRKKGADNWGNSSDSIKEEYTRIQKNGNTFTVLLTWKSIPKRIQIFFPNMKIPTKQEVEFEINKIYPGATVLSFKPDKIDPTKPYLFSGEIK